MNWYRFDLRKLWDILLSGSSVELWSSTTEIMINSNYQRVLMINFNDFIHSDIISMSKNDSFERTVVDKEKGYRGEMNGEFRISDATILYRVDKQQGPTV